MTRTLDELDNLPLVELTVDERRESPRLALTLRVQSTPFAPPEATVGDLSLGGVGWSGAAREVGSRITVTLNLGGNVEVLRVDAEIFRVSRRDGAHWHQARFVEMDLETELLIARWLHERAQARAA